MHSLFGEQNADVSAKLDLDQMWRYIKFRGEQRNVSLCDSFFLFVCLFVFFLLFFGQEH